MASVRYIVDGVDPALIAEYLEHIAASYRRDTDTLTRYWIAIAVGKAGTPGANAVLDSFGWDDEPLPQEGIRQARDLLSSSGLITR